MIRDILLVLLMGYLAISAYGMVFAILDSDTEIRSKAEWKIRALDYPKRERARLLLALIISIASLIYIGSLL